SPVSQQERCLPGPARRSLESGSASDPLRGTRLLSSPARPGTLRIMHAPYHAPYWIALLVGIASGSVGPFILLRRMALVGDALSHVALPGIALALVYGLDPFEGGVVFLVVAAFRVCVPVRCGGPVRSFLRVGEALSVPDLFPGPAPGAWPGPPLQPGAVAGL